MSLRLLINFALFIILIFSSLTLIIGIIFLVVGKFSQRDDMEEIGLLTMMKK